MDFKFLRCYRYHVLILGIRLFAQIINWKFVSLTAACSVQFCYYQPVTSLVQNKALIYPFKQNIHCRYDFRKHIWASFLQSWLEETEAPIPLSYGNPFDIYLRHLTPVEIMFWRTLSRAVRKRFQLERCSPLCQCLSSRNIFVINI